MSKKKLYPTKSRVIMSDAREQQADTFEGGIFVPTSLGGETHEHEVIAVGPECRAVKPGDIVLSDKYKGIEVTVDHVNYMIINEDELLAII
jgi:chaperonin GroES